MNLTLYPHGGSGNHGCEAIVRATAHITGASLKLFSSRPDEDHRYGLDRICTILNDHQQFHRTSLQFWRAFLKYKLGDAKALDTYYFSPIIQEAEHSDYALSIGGDNYCYGVPENIYLINQTLRQRGVKTILWGCSIEPNAIDHRMLHDLKGYHHIIARESITYHALQEKGVENVSLIPDPAFMLQREDLPLPDGFIPGNTVGINVSPLIVNYESHHGATMRNYFRLVEHIINHTDMNIALIPHVVWPDNDDRKPLDEIYQHYSQTGRVVMIQDCNAEQLKGYIARCRFMVAARTHASIAAYSSQVPTLVVGYSVKAHGIATDLFGTSENYVLPVQSLENDEYLANSFLHLKENEAEILAQYSQTMPQYIQKVVHLKDYLK